MGNKQVSTANWSVDDWAYGTGENAVSIDEVMHETSKIPAKYFGGEAIENDASMHQMQHDLLSFDETLKNLFRRKKNKRSKKHVPTSDEYYYEEQLSEATVEQQIDSEQNQNHLQPIFTDGNNPPALVPITEAPINERQNFNKAIWRCSNCTVENKITERVCRRCGEAETRL